MSQTLDTKSRLIEATIQAISEGGEGSVRVQTIAEAAEVKEPSVYHFFKNRVELVEAAQSERYRRSYLEMMVPFRAVVEMAESREEFLIAVRKFFNLIYAPTRHDVRSVRINVIGSAQTSPRLAVEIKKMNHEVASELSEIIAETKKKKWVSEDLDTLAFAYWIMGQIMGRVLAEMDTEYVDLKEWNKVSVDAVIMVLQNTSA